jgi:chromosome segregation ATPase
MVYMYDIFESIFHFINELGLVDFTNLFLGIQLGIFVVMIGFFSFKIGKEQRAMKKVKPELEKLKKFNTSNDSSLDSQGDAIFQKIKKTRYADLWSRYYHRISEKKGDDEKIRVEPFFSFDVLLHHMGYRSWMDAGAGVSVSIGVLGTFIGLSVGLSELNVGNTEALRTGISSLLDGMKIAFYTSVFGVFLSLVWVFLDRFMSQRLEHAIDWHAEKLDYLFNTDDEELFLNRLEKISSSQSDHLKTVLTDVMEKVLKPVVDQLERSQDQTWQHFQQLDHQFQGISKSLSTQNELLNQQLTFNQSNSSSMTEQLVNQITGGTQQSIAEFSNLLNDSKNMQGMMVNTLGDVVNKFVETEKHQAKTAERTEEMFSKFHKISGELSTLQEHYQGSAQHMEQLNDSLAAAQKLSADHIPIQLDVMKSNQALAQKYDSLTDHFQTFNTAIETRHEELLNEIVTVSRSLTSSYETMTERFAKTLENQTATIQESDRLLEQIQHVVTHLTPLAPDLKEVVGNLDELKMQIKDMQGLQNSLLPELSALRTDTNQTVSEALTSTKTYMNEMTTQLDHMKQHWETTREQFESTRETLQHSVKEFSDNIDAGLSKTFTHFDETLTNSVKHVSSYINQFGDLQQDLIEGLDDLTEELSKNKKGISS